MKENKRRLTALAMALIMMFTLSGCTIVDMDFMRYGWDGIVNGIVIWVNPERANKPADENKSDNGNTGDNTNTADATEPTTDENGNATDNSQAGTNDNGSGNNGGTKNGGSNGGTNNGGSNGGTNNGGSNGGTNNGGTNNGGTNNGGNNGGTNNGGSNGGNNNGGNNGGTNNGGNNGGTDNGGNSGSTEKTYTTEEAINLYKNAANPVKSTSGYTVTRTREKYIELGGNLSGVSATIVKKAFSEKDDTTAKTYSSQSDIQKNFVVEKQSYVCALTTADVTSATVTPSGDNLIVKIYVKDDEGQGQDHSNKAVSATAVSDLAVPLSMGKLDYMACKGVWLEATINAAGQLTNLHTYMPAYFYGGNEYFAVALEQWWTISK